MEIKYVGSTNLHSRHVFLSGRRFDSIIARLWNRKQLHHFIYNQQNSISNMNIWHNNLSLTVSPIFFANVVSVIFANGLSAPQHSTYFVILVEGLDLVTPPAVDRPKPSSLTTLLCLSVAKLGGFRFPFDVSFAVFWKKKNKSMQHNSELKCSLQCAKSSLFNKEINV